MKQNEAIDILAHHASTTLPDSVQQRRQLLLAMSTLMSDKHPGKQAVLGNLARLSQLHDGELWLRGEFNKSSGFSLTELLCAVAVLCLTLSFCITFFTRLTAGCVIGAVAVICGAAIAMLLRQQKKDQS